MSTYLFLDTNIYLHFIQFDQIKWKELLNIDEFTIVIPTAVISELEKNKINKTSRISKQAKQIIKLLEKYSDNKTSPKLVKVFFLPNDNYTNLCKNYSLDIENPDNKIIVSILEFIEKKSENVILVTSDLGIKLTANNFEIKTYEPPEDQQIKIEDETDKRIKELEKENAFLKNQIPELKIIFDNNLTYKHYRLFKFDLEEFNINEKIQSEKQRLPFKTFEVENSKLKINSFLGLNNTITKQEYIDSYNKDLKEYYLAYEKYLQKELKYQELFSKSCKIDLVLVNNGSVPADDIRINLHIPDGVEIIDGSKFPSLPKKPQEPKLLSLFDSLNSFLFPSNILAQNFIPTHFPKHSNVSGLNIKKSKSYDIGVSVQRLMHNYNINLDTFYIIFDNNVEPFPFKFTYSIIGEKIPKSITGELNIIIDKD